MAVLKACFKLNTAKLFVKTPSFFLFENGGTKCKMSVTATRKHKDALGCQRVQSEG